MKAFNSDGHTAEAIEQIYDEASLRARAEVIDWLVPQLVQTYRQAIEQRLQPAATPAPETGLYLYAIAEAGPGGDVGTLGRAAGMVGIDGRPVLTIRQDRTCALASELPLACLSAATDCPDVSETGWLARAVRTHEAVTEAVLGRVALLPLRFGTVYSSTEAVLAALARHQHALLGELNRLGRATEWGLQISLPDEAGGAGREPGQPHLEPARLTAPAEPQRPGTDWMLLRHASLRGAHRRHEQLDDCVSSVRTALGPHAREATGPSATAPEQARALSFLVDDVPDFQAAYQQVQARYAANGFRFRLTGPWPPYHFVRLGDLEGSHHG